ncbi:MAG: DUF3605 domain-containing protein [Candidatus Shapirobacteria bacterium]|jgi:hypothetical protein
MVDLISSVDVPNNWEEFVKLKPILPFCIAEVSRLSEDLHFHRIYIELVSKEIRLEILEKLIGNNDVCLIKNNFPYTRLLQNLPKVKHCCLWSRKGKLSPKIIEKEIKKTFPNNDFFWFENTEVIKSVPEIWHCHVFIKLN